MVFYSQMSYTLAIFTRFQVGASAEVPSKQKSFGQDVHLPKEMVKNVRVSWLVANK